MEGPLGSDVTLLLSRLREGNPAAAEQLIPLVYGELRAMAGSYLRNERPGHTLQATALVNEAYLRLVGEQTPENRAHFFAIAANTMRRILLDYARRRRAVKRGGAGAKRVDLDAELLVGEASFEGLLEIDEALERLARLDQRQAQLVELRFFAGMDVDEAASAMGLSPSTVKREWRIAKAWLVRELASLTTE